MRVRAGPLWDVDGVVRSIPFSSGQDVAQGALLVQIDDSVEQAELKSAQADFRRFSADYERNRDLVERALRQKQQSPQSSRNGQQGRQGAASSGQQPQSAAGQQGRSASQQSGGASQQSGRAAQQAGSASQQSGANSGSSSSGQDSGQSGNPQQSGSPQAAGAYGSGTSKEAPGQAQRDAALAADLARKQQQRGASGNSAQAQGSGQNGKSEVAPKDGRKQPDTGSLLAGGTQAPKQKPETERQLALDQWLRQIPDSPAGLLQRKFLIEHMMKQQDSGDSQDSGQ